MGIITGLGEGIALILRLLTGSWADRSQRHWRLTVVGYAMTAISLPLLAVTPFLGAAGVAVAATLILLESVVQVIAFGLMLIALARPPVASR